jgi:hypothetical protein
MSTWTRAELDAVASAAELTISTRGADGTLRPPVPVWVVRAGERIFIRSWKGPDGTWFRHASTHGTALISAGGVERDVTVTVTGTTERTAIDQAYRAKYGRYGPGYAAPMAADPAAQTTMRLSPAQ